MIHTALSLPTTMILLLVCAVVGYGAHKRGDWLWTLGCAGFALFLFWPQWPQVAYRALRSFITLNPEGAYLLASIVFLIVCAFGLKHIIVGSKHTKNRSWF